MSVTGGEKWALTREWPVPGTHLGWLGLPTELVRALEVLGDHHTNLHKCLDRGVGQADQLRDVLVRVNIDALLLELGVQRLDDAIPGGGVLCWLVAFGIPGMTSSV